MDKPESQLPSDPALTDVLTELTAREPLFHRPEYGTTRADFDRLTAADYWEVGASGNRYSREHVWSALERRYAVAPPIWPEPDWAIGEFEVRALAGDTYLLTYVLRQSERLTRRSTIWQRREHGWAALYHQGTVITTKFSAPGFE
ncbi:nuclear transport factor 2 family protein [Nocardia inohanensis]|uniref:nuclear transport factor 2 family protein n=1 Tax=Nocardia inohanensis TaxID=209246 RepID=UPI00082B8102|nr:DUF4440 domain-containing protein [Nocardia inohanensis]